LKHTSEIKSGICALLQAQLDSIKKIKVDISTYDMDINFQYEGFINEVLNYARDDYTYKLDAEKQDLSVRN